MSKRFICTLKQGEVNCKHFQLKGSWRLCKASTCKHKWLYVILQSSDIKLTGGK